MDAMRSPSGDASDDVTLLGKSLSAMDDFIRRPVRPEIRLSNLWRGGACEMRHRLPGL